MTDWLAPAVVVEGPGGRRVPCDWTADGAKLEAITGVVGDGAAVVVRYARGREGEASALKKRIEAAGYSYVRVERAKS